MPPSNLHTRSHEALPRAVMEGGRYGNEYFEGARSELVYPPTSHERRNSSESGSGIAGPILSHFDMGNPAPEEMVSVMNLPSVAMASMSEGRSWGTKLL